MTLNIVHSDYGDIIIHKMQLENEEQATYFINQKTQGVSIKEADLSKFLEMLNKSILEPA